MEQTGLLESQREPQELGTHPVKFKSLDGHEYEGKLLIFANYTRASSPCLHDKKTTRDFLKERTKLPRKDEDVNMGEILLNMFNLQDGLPSKLPTHVLKIVTACADDDGLVDDVATGKKIRSGSTLSELLDTYINNCLKGRELCNEHIIDSTVLNQLLVAI